MKTLHRILIAAALFAACPFARAQFGTTDLTVSKTVKYTGFITPAQITANADDYAPTGYATTAFLRLSTDASRNLTGLLGGAAGRFVWISNVGSFDLVIKNQSTSSTAANRFALDSDLTLKAGMTISLWYDTTASRWQGLSNASLGTAITALTGDVTATGPGSASATVTKINGVSLGSLATGILKNTTSTGVPSIASAGDFPTLNQDTSGNAATATALATGRTIAITGDISYTSPSFDGSGNVTAAATLPTVNSDVGTFGSSSLIPVITTNAKGQITAVSTASAGGGGGTASGLSLLDSSAAFHVNFAASSSTTLTADRIFTLDMANAARTLKMTGNAVLNQDLTTGASPTFFGMTISGSGGLNVTAGGGNILCDQVISAGGAYGFQSTTFVANSRNPIWSFGNASGYGLSWFQGSSGIGGSDSIGFHFGTATSAGSSVNINASGMNGPVGASSPSTGAFTSLTYSGVPTVSVDTLSGAGAVSVTKETTKLTSTGSAQAITLANGADGQVKKIIHDVDGGSMVLTPTTATGWSTATFTNAGDSLALEYVTTRGWIVIASYGTTVAP